jgi:hypothetical protein
MAMKKLLFVLMALLVVAFTVPAMAFTVPGGNGGGSHDPYNSTLNVKECFDINYDFSKCKVIIEPRIAVDAFLTLSFTLLFPDGRADATVVKKQINEGNDFGSPSCIFLSDSIRNSFYNFHGIGQANQSAGYMNNQANVVNAAVVSTTKPYVSAEVLDMQLNDGLKVTQSDPAGFRLDPAYFDTICNSFNAFTGVGQVNQSAGFANNQNNVVNVAFGTKGAMIATSDTVLEQVNINNNVSLRNVVSSCVLSDSFNGSFTGIGQVNQSSGSFNNQANVVSFAGTK